MREGLQVRQRYAAITAPHIKISNLDYRHDRIIRFQMMENLGDVHVLYQELCLFLTRRVLQDLTGGRAQVRLEQAKRQLQQTRLPIKTICSNAGFTNVSAFSRAFRKHTNLTPGDYRQNT